MKLIIVLYFSRVKWVVVILFIVGLGYVVLRYRKKSKSKKKSLIPTWMTKEKSSK